MSKPPGAKLAVERLEDRTVPTFLPTSASPNTLVNGVRLGDSGAPGVSIAIGDLNPEGFNIARNEYVIATGPGPVGTVSVYSLLGNRENQFVPFAGFTGGLNVAVGDVIGDSRSEIVVVAAGNGPSQVGVFTSSGQLLASFMAFDAGFTGGLNVAVGNVSNDGNPLDIGTGGGGPQPRVKSEIIIGAAAGITPHVKVFDGSGNLQRSFYAFDEAYRGGVVVAAASIDTTRVPDTIPGPGRPPDTNSYAEIIVGAATNEPHVKVFSVWQGSQTLLQSYFAFDPNNPANRGGVTLAAGNTDGNRGAEIYVGLIGGSRVRAIAGESTGLIAEFTAFPDAPLNYSRVVNMAVGNTGQFDPLDDDSFFGNGGNVQDLAVVAGDGPPGQQPRYYRGLPNSAAGRNGPG